MDKALDVDQEDHLQQEEAAEARLVAVEAKMGDVQNTFDTVLETVKESRNDLKNALDEKLENTVQIVEDTEREIHDFEELKNIVEYLEEGVQFADDLMNEWLS
jgi:gas vesicle protein